MRTNDEMAKGIPAPVAVRKAAFVEMSKGFVVRIKGRAKEMIGSREVACKGASLAGVFAGVVVSVLLSAGNGYAQASGDPVVAQVRDLNLPISEEVFRFAVRSEVPVGGLWAELGARRWPKNALPMNVSRSVATLGNGAAVVLHREPVPVGQAPSGSQRRSTWRKVAGGVVGGVGGFFGGGYLGAAIEGDRCNCDDPGLKGFVVGAPIGALIGGILGAKFIF